MASTTRGPVLSARATQPRVTFILCSPCSGSTLLGRFLESRSGARFLGEAERASEKFRDDMPCACGRTLQRCEFWTAVFGAAATGTGGSDLERLYRAAAEVGPPDLIDSSKRVEHAHEVAAIASSVDVRAIQLLRDPRGVVNSRRRARARRRSRPERPAPIASRLGLLLDWKDARRWKRTHSAGRRALERAGIEVLTIRYEDFVEDPDATVSTLAEFLGWQLEHGANTGARELDLVRGHAVAGNRNRFEVGKVALELDDAWRDELPRHRRRMVDLVTGRLARAVGYSRDR